jgi:succinate dehydrogenase / fumarate reductase cytochrome b subunit
MAANDNRPFYLNLLKIRLPLPGIVSIMHRISGVFMFIAIPFVVFIFELSLRDQNGFRQATEMMSHPLVVVGMMVLLWSLVHHFFAGIRFLLIDFDIGLDKAPSIQTSWLVLVLEVLVIAAILLGIYL